MRKTIFLAIMNCIKEKVSDVKYIDLWNQHMAELAATTSFKTPAVFVEFEEYQLRQLANHVTEADINIRLHIVTRSVNANGINDRKLETSLEYLDLIDKVNTAITRLSGDMFSTLMHTSSATNHNHAELLESIERYQCRFVDRSSVREHAVIKPDIQIINEAW